MSPFRVKLHGAWKRYWVVPRVLQKIPVAILGVSGDRADRSGISESGVSDQILRRRTIHH
jgi:hypothetical protein